jgi:hypothetical protein
MSVKSKPVDLDDHASLRPDEVDLETGDTRIRLGLWELCSPNHP